MSFQAIMYLLLFHFALIGVQGSSYYAILNGTNGDTSLLNHNTDVGKLPDCAKRCEEEQCASFTFNQVQKSCKTYSTRHRLSLDLTTDGYTYFQKRNEGENRFVRVAETYVFNNKTWTVVQKRYDGSQSFNRDWNEYKNGFGDPYGEYWIGLEAMHQLIARSPHALLIILESWAGVMKHALYDQFYLASETDHYRLNVSGYNGTAGNCLEEMGHNYMAFSTKDKDNDLAAGSCANSFKSGYWYSQCSSCNINGPMKPDTGRQDRYAVIWFTFSNKFMPLRKIKMLISRMP